MTKVIISNADPAQKTERIFLGEGEDGADRYVDVGKEVDLSEKDIALVSRNFGVEVVEDKPETAAKPDESQQAASAAPQAPGSPGQAASPAAGAPAAPTSPGTSG